MDHICPAFVIRIVALMRGSQLLLSSQTSAAGQYAEIKEQKFRLNSYFLKGGVPTAMGHIYSEFWG